jgi:hypothetical protein
MFVYISCSSKNEGFVNVIKEAVEDFNKENQNVKIEYFFPPNAGASGGIRISDNIRKILDADLVVFDLTPDSDDNEDECGNCINSGVLIEFGIIYSLLLIKERTQLLLPYTYLSSGIQINTPDLLIFLSDKCKKSNFTPILSGDFSIISYNLSNKEFLKKQIKKKIIKRVNFKLSPNTPLPNSQSPFSVSD